MGCSLEDLCLQEHTSRIDKIIFIRIPKTASTSIFDCVIKFFRNRYAPGCMWHIDYSTWRNWKTSDSFSFACVRNPFSEIRSRYLTYMSQEWPKILSVSRQLQDDPLSFTSYVRSCCIDTQTLIDSKSYHIISFNQIVTRSRFWQIFDENGMCQVDAIIRFERVSDGIKKIFCDYFGEDLKHLPASNVSTDRSSYKDHYTDETRELVESYYKNDLEMFGYNFNGPTDDEIFVNPKSVTISPFSWDDLLSSAPIQERFGKRARYFGRANSAKQHMWDEQMGCGRILGSDGKVVKGKGRGYHERQEKKYRAQPDSKPISSPGPNYRWDGRKWVVAQRSSSQPPSKSKRGNPNPATMDWKSVEGVNCPNPATMDRKSVEGVNCGMPRKEQRSQNSIRKKSSKQLVNGFAPRHKKAERYRTVNGRKIKV